MHIAVHNDSAAWRIITMQDGEHTTISDQEARAQAGRALGLPPEDIQVWPVPAGQEDAYRTAALEAMTVRRDDQGQLTAVELPVTLYLHVAISGQAGTYQGIPLFAPGDSMSVQVALRVGSDPDSTVAPISGTWPIPVLAADGSEYDRVFVTTTGGQASFNYVIPDRTGKCALSEQGMDRIASGGAVYQIRLAQPVQFFVGRTPAAG